MHHPLKLANQREHIGSGAHHNKITIGADNRVCHLLSKDYWEKRALRFVEEITGQLHGRGESNDILWEMGKILLVKKGRKKN